jgi:hypothetical protein
MPLQDREEMLLLQAGEKLQFVPQVRKEALTCFGRAVRGRKDFFEKVIRLIGWRLAEMF